MSIEHEPTTAETAQTMVHDAMHDADEMLRQNPIPAVIGALAIGFLVGMLVRGGESEPASHLDKLRDQTGGNRGAPALAAQRRQ